MNHPFHSLRRLFAIPGLAATALFACSEGMAQIPQQQASAAVSESAKARVQSIIPASKRNSALAAQAASGGPVSRLQSVTPMLAQNTPPSIPPQRPGIPPQEGSALGPQGTAGSAATPAPKRPGLPGGVRNIRQGLAQQPALPGQNPAGATTPNTAAASTPKPKSTNPDEVELQFINEPLAEILLQYEEMTGKKIIRDINVEGATMTIETTGTMSKADAIEFMEKTLLLNGYAFVPSGEKFLKLLAFDSKKPPSEGGVPIYAKVDELPQTDQVVNYFMPLMYIEPDDAAKVLAELIPPHSYGKISAVPNSRAIIITENSATIRSIVEMLKHLDAEPSRTTQKTFLLTRENAEDVKKALDEILDTEKKGSGSSGGASAYSGTTQQQRPPATPQPGTPIPGQPNAAAATASRGAIVTGGGSSNGSSAAVAPKIIAIPRTNSLLVIARPVDMTSISALIAELDAAAHIQNFIIRPLKYLAALDALDVLEQAINRGEPSGGSSGGARRSSSSPATSSGTNTNQTTSGLGRSGFGSSGSAFGGSSSGGFGGGGYGGGGFGGGSSIGGGANLQALRDEQGPQALLVGKTLLIADSAQNEIFASGPPEHLRIMQEILDELDQRPKQILISAVIGEVTLADGVEFGLDWLLRPTEVRYNGNSGIVAGALRNTPAGILDPSTIETVADLAEIGNGLTLYGAINDNVNVVVNALKSNTAFKVISRPSVFTLNNKPASIASGTSIPVPTQTFSSYNTGVDGNTGLTSNIQYQDIALSLDVVPLINSDDELTLQISQQNNEQSGTTTINGNPYPTISNQSVNTIVMVKNNATVLLGGLIRENVTKEKNGIPILSSIPILKYLSGSTKATTTRRELLVFIQPRIVTGVGDLPPNVDDNAGQSAFSNETRAFLKQEQSAPVPPVKNTRLGRLIEKLLY